MPRSDNEATLLSSLLLSLVLAVVSLIRVVLYMYINKQGIKLIKLLLILDAVEL